MALTMTSETRIARLIVKDLVKRRWWVFVLGAVFTVLPAPEQSLTLVIIVPFLGVLLVSWDAALGAFRAYGTLPVKYETLGKVAWIEGVIMFPLVYLSLQLLAYPLAPFLPLIAHPPNVSTVLSTCLLGMGASALMLLVSVYRSSATRLPASVTRVSIFIGLLLVLLIVVKFGVTSFAYALEPRIERLFAVLTVVAYAWSALLVFFFWFESRCFAEVWTGACVATATPPSRHRTLQPAVVPVRLRGFRGQWVERVWWTVLFPVAVWLAICLAPITIFPATRERFTGNDDILPTCFLFVCLLHFSTVFSFITPHCLPSLRILPISRLALTLYLMSFPVTAFLIVLVVLAPFLAATDAWGAFPEILACLTILLAFILGGVIVSLRFGWLPAFLILIAGLWVTLAAIIAWTLLKLRYQVFQQPAPTIGLVEALTAVLIALATAFLSILYLIKNSSAIYRRKPPGVKRWH